MEPLLLEVVVEGLLGGSFDCTDLASVVVAAAVDEEEGFG